LVGSISLVEEELQAVVDKGQVEEQAVSGQAVSAVTNDLDATLRIISIQTGQNLVVRKAVGSFHDSIGRGPGLDDLVVILLELRRSAWETIYLSLDTPMIIYLVVAHGHGLVDVVSNGANLAVPFQFLLNSSILSRLLALLQLILLRHQLARILLVL
jgi:hypothetical protein